MCQTCVDAVRKYYPDLPEENYCDLLMGATCFPFGTPSKIAGQLARLRKKTDGSLQAALAFADAETEASMKKISKKE